MAETWPPPLDFPAYLEAKAEVDEAGLNPALYARFRRLLEAHPSPRLLDLGTGTGAMLRRLLGWELRGEPLLCGLDQDPALLMPAARRIAQELERRGYRVQSAGISEGSAAGTGASAVHRISGRRGKRRIEVRLASGDLLAPDALRALEESRFGFLTAHAFLDLLPLDSALAVIRGLMSPSGVLYATSNYDGSTALLPPFRDEAFEEALLSAYDRSMEARRVGGEATGGAHCGRRLYGALERGGFRLLGAGSSDWNVLPEQGRLAEGPALFLKSILAMIAAEGLRAGLAAEPLRLWHRERLASIEAGRLGLIVHQLDMLAVRD